MRILIKGGVWKNTEDEILKAAVMKYGLNQWARISSLLTRKSAKQCKARWYEWLDPAIKKTEWTREEDEKLLHLAKLMPTQWRTIAPIVGRTPVQCLERYEKLLDMAAGKETYDPTDDPRRLRPGEIDPNPESKPARPDPIDMDEDEKEMLSEARARLANTKGKKAKRKAREKQLEEARRLATLQKKRELKAAGIEVRERTRRGGAIDYSKEVPFERRAAAGFFDTREEATRTSEMQEDFRPITVDELEGRKRKDIEKELIKADLAKARVAERANAPAALARALAANEASAGPVRRGKLMLPAPAVTDEELEALARGGYAAADRDADVAAGGSAATRGLLGDYATPGRVGGAPTPARGGAAPPGPSRVMQEAANLAALTAGATPLLGGENPVLHPSDFSGVTPRATPAATPGTHALGGTPAATLGTHALGGVAIAATPRGGRVSGGGATPAPVPTPLRDALGLNEAAASASSKREEAARLALLRNDLRAGLAQLPGPRNEYQVVVPELAPAEGAVPDGFFEEDAADAAQRRAAAAEAERCAALRRASQAVQRGLPRPAPDAARALASDPPATTAGGEADALRRASALLGAELAALLAYEAEAFPAKAEKGKGKGAAAAHQAASLPPLEQFASEALASAAQLLAAETAAVRAGTGHAGSTAEEAAAASAAAAADIILLPSTGRFVRGASASAAERAAALGARFDHARHEMEREARRAAKLEARAGLLTAGLAARGGRLAEEAAGATRDLAAAALDLACFGELAAREAEAGPARVAELAALVAAQRAREAALQDRYRAARDAVLDARRPLPQAAA
uniref:Cell division cycle 5-like protein n=1 Tax=Auxenochlorella protothecoides TaxID=3075 RepID=A0A1D2A2M5_AUXPR